MKTTVPGTTNPFMRCGAALADPAMPALERSTVQDFVKMLEDFFVGKPNVLQERIDDFILRFEVSEKVFGGGFIGVLLNAIANAGILSKVQHEQWGISWFPTYSDLLDLCREFLAAEANSSAQAA